jgi:hypothetical protein
LQENLIGICISMMPWAHTFDIFGLPNLSQYFAIFETYETTAHGRKFLRGFRELFNRLTVLLNARRAFTAAAVADPESPADRTSSREGSDNGDQDLEGDQDEGEQGTRPPASSSSTSVGDFVLNEKKVCVLLELSAFSDLFLVQSMPTVSRSGVHSTCWPGRRVSLRYVLKR